jgi:osmotically-inducible protein OsmY
MNGVDRELSKKIRQAIVADKSLSTYAHNVKIISRDGVVTLKGPVHSDVEKSTIEAKAAEIAGGADKVKSEIAVKQ